MSNLYTLIIHFYHLLIRISALFVPKAKLWVKGRKNIFQHIRQSVDNHKPLVWFHCASLGEFEQGRPVMEAFRKAFPHYRILLTFFSPSGYEVRKNYEGADYIFYLPVDTKRNARRFVAYTRPQAAIFVKYEFWFNYLNELKKGGIPVLSISAIFRPGQRFFKKSAWWQRKKLRSIDHFFVQNETSKQLLKTIGINHVTVSGDTRFDRVHAVAEEKKAFPLIEKFRDGNRLFLAGSTWPRDEELVFSLIKKNPDLKFIFAPHEVHTSRISGLINRMPEKPLLFSEAGEENIHSSRILIIDSIGILLHLYQYAHMAYIGGGFGVGIHNILEAATFGMPVIFGPNYHKFQEARDLISLGAAFSVSSEAALNDIANRLLSDPEFLKHASQTSRSYVEEKRGATEMIIGNLRKIL